MDHDTVSTPEVDAELEMCFAWRFSSFLLYGNLLWFLRIYGTEVYAQ